MKQRRSGIGRMAAVCIAASACLAAAGPAGSQTAQPTRQTLRPPNVNESDDPPTIRMYLVAALLGALVVGANLTPSKRGHQD